METTLAMPTKTPDYAAIKERQQATWASGDFAVIGTTLQIVGETLGEAADVRAGERVLDVAAGNGNATLAAARRFADVTASDYVPALLEKCRRRAAAEGLTIRIEPADVEALPAGTRNVLATDIEDDCMPALARLRGLEQLEIVAEWASPGMRKVLPAVRSVTDAGLRNLDGLPRLRILRLGGELEVEGPGLEVLAHLPALEELSLELMKVDDAGLANLARAARLQRLRLSYAQGFGRPTTDVVARLTSLRELSLTGCVHMDEQWLAQLAAMRQLESLDLSMIGSHSLSSGLSVPLPPAEPGSGVTDGVLAALAGATNLRTLLLGQAGITGSGLRHLQGLPGLGSLDLGGTPVTGADLRWLPPGIEVLSLHGCRDLGQEFGPVLAAATPRLRSLDLLGCANVGIAGLHALQAVRSLRVLDVSYWPEFGVDSAATEAKSAVAAVTARTGLDGLTLRGWMPSGEQERSALRAMPNLKRLDTDQGTETLR